MLNPDDLDVDDVDLARRVIVRARAIAPCIDSLEGERLEELLSVLRGVVAEIPPAGTRRVKSKSRNGTAISYESSGSWFSADDVAALRSLCAAAAPSGTPIGSFPVSRAFAGIWPEEKYPGD